MRDDLADEAGNRDGRPKPLPAGVLPIFSLALFGFSSKLVCGRGGQRSGAVGFVIAGACFFLEPVAMAALLGAARKNVCLREEGF